MGCENSRQKYLKKLIEVSSGALNERDLEDIMMNTYYNEKELFYLYNKFQKLGPNNKGKISSSQLFEIEEFKFCAFKKLLPKALKLDDYDPKITTDPGKRAPTKKNTIAIRDEFIEEEEDEEEKEKDDVALNIKQIKKSDNVESNTNFNKLILNENKMEINDEVEGHAINSNEGVDQEDRIIENKDGKENVLEGDINNKDQFGSRNQYIDFPKFCDILKIFNANFPVDTKIRFYFRLFDVDGDGRISKKDIQSFLVLLFPEDNIAEELVDESVKSATKDLSEIKDKVDFDKLIDIIFGEIVFNEKRKYIDYDEFSKVMWTTTIDKTCVIDCDHDI